MIKVVVGNINAFHFLRSIPVLRKFIVFNISSLREIEDEILRCDAISTISTSNDIMKTTRVGRFSELNDVINKFFNKNEMYVIHDVAISSGVTAVELYEYLSSEKKNFIMFTSDKFSTYNIQGKYFRRIYDSEFNPSFFYFIGIYFGPALNWKFFVSKYLYSLLKLFKFNKYSHYEIVSVINEKMNCFIRDGKITHMNYDIFETKIYDKFNFVRCMNVLNKVYFDNELILKGIENIFISMKDGCILQVGRTDDAGVNNVSFYRKSGSKLELLEILNNGSELHELIQFFNKQHG